MSLRHDIVALSQCIPEGHWTSYSTVSEVVYGHPGGARTVGETMRLLGTRDSAHRVLQAAGTISPGWIGEGGGPEECERRLRAEGSWDETRGRARPHRFLGAEALRQRARQVQRAAAKGCSRRVAGTPAPW